MLKWLCINHNTLFLLFIIFEQILPFISFVTLYMSLRSYLIKLMYICWIIIIYIFLNKMNSKHSHLTTSQGTSQSWQGWDDRFHSGSLKDTTVIRTLSVLYCNNSHMRCDLRGGWLTAQTGQHADVSSIEQWQCIVIDVQVRKMRDEVIPHQKTHQNPVVYDPLQVVLKRDLILMEMNLWPDYRSVYCLQ